MHDQTTLHKQSSMGFNRIGSRLGNSFFEGALYDGSMLTTGIKFSAPLTGKRDESPSQIAT